MAGNPVAFLPAAFLNSAFQTGDGVSPAPDDEVSAPITYGGGDHEYHARVRAKWAEIEALRAERLERERQEADRADELEQAKKRADKARKVAAEAAETTSRKRKAAAHRVAKAEAEVAALETELGWLGETMESLQGQIDAVLHQIEVDEAAALVAQAVAREQVAEELAAQAEAEHQVMLARRRMMMALLLTVQ